MEESEATFGIGMNYDYITRAANAVIERQRYFEAYLHRYQKNNLGEKD